MGRVALLERVDGDGPLEEDLVDGGRARGDRAQVVGQLGQTAVCPALLLPVSEGGEGLETWLWESEGFVSGR